MKDACVFLHTESEKCRYGELCGRINGMFRHEDNVGDIVEDIIKIEKDEDPERMETL